ncbi:hypothetical protein [Nocardia sp. CDC160]|uniref:hypothetical protein n=1 Tax=Nocardia sp. CDC160 TaxID=3112166 RepID=UPI002DBFBE29|nr:hypothetical protein [Nocardia sp. CDC160]MEC3920277.1 hypothetical protein [Nocardia sp. CDC160]
MQWTGADTVVLRKAVDLTQEQMAAVIGCSIWVVKKWARRGETIVLGEEFADAMDTLLARAKPAQQQRFTQMIEQRQSDRTAPRTHGAGVVGEWSRGGASSGECGLYAWEVDDDVRRRDFGLAAVAGAAMLVLGDREHLGSSDVSRLLAGVDALEREDQRSGGAGLVDFAVEQLARHKHRLDTGDYTAATGTAYASATGQLAVLAGWLAYDADRHPLARRCYADAMEKGTESGDDDLIAHTCLYAANQSIALSRIGAGSPHRALTLTARARDLMAGRPPGRIHALIAVREAQARGVLEDRAGFGRALAMAWREMDQAAAFEPLEQTPQWLRFVTHAEIAGHEARGYADIGELTRAVELYGAAAEQQAGTRNATNLRAWSATTRAQIGDLTGALEEATPVLTSLAKVSSTRTLRVLEPLRTAVDQLTIGSGFRDQFDSLATKAITA